MFEFKQATKEQAKARIALIGPSGSGKTYTALRFASALGDNIAVIDTENASASKYADEFDFSVLNLESDYAPQTYVQAIKAAEKAGFDVLIIDSLSHAWIGKGGALEQVDKASAKYKNNSFAAWRDVTPHHNALVDALVQCSCHLIVTMRAKTQYDVSKDNDGKVKPVKIGLAPVQRDGLEYEFDIVADIDLDHNLIVSKTRCRALDGEVVNKAGEDTAGIIADWLTDGKELPPSFTTLDALLDAFKSDFDLGKDDALATLKKLGFTGFPKNGGKRQKSREMYQAVKAAMEEQASGNGYEAVDFSRFASKVVKDIKFYTDTDHVARALGELEEQYDPQNEQHLFDALADHAEAQADQKAAAA